MSLRTVKLDTISLVKSTEKLKLCVSSAADIRIADALGTNLGQTSKAMPYANVTARDFWICRDAVCFEIEVLINGKRIDQESRIQILERLGCGIRDAQLWSLLALSASLEIPQGSDSRQSLFSIKINPSVPNSSTNSDSRARPWFLRNADVRCPESVPRARLEKLHIELNFITIPAKSKSTAKRSKLISAPYESEDDMLLDIPPKPALVTHLEGLEEAVDSLRGLSDSMVRCFDHEKCSVHQPRNLDGKGISTVRTFPKQIIDVLNDWHNPRRTETDKIELMRRTGLQRRQLNQALNYYEKRLTSQAKEEDAPEMLLSSHDWNFTDTRLSEEEEMLLLGDAASTYNEQLRTDFQYMSIQAYNRQVSETCCTDDADILLPSSQESSITVSTLSLDQQSSLSHSNISTTSLITSTKRAAEDDTIDNQDQDLAIGINTILSSNLTDIAIRTLVAGDSNRYHRVLEGVTLRRPYPETSLSELAPALFNLNFNLTMAQSSHFLPKISRTISGSLLENTQSPSLKRKLVQVANASATAPVNPDDTSIADRLSSAIQSRLWSMMQRNVYDPLASREIWRKALKNDVPGDDDEFPELFSPQEETPQEASVNCMEENLFESDFDDLLEREEDKLLLEYTGDEERGSDIPENETIEMLFGNVSDEVVSDDEVLLSGGSEENSMLV